MSVGVGRKEAGCSQVEIHLAQYLLGRRHVFPFGLGGGVLRVAVPLHLLISPTLTSVGPVALPADLGCAFHAFVRACSLPDFGVEIQLGLG